MNLRERVIYKDNKSMSYFLESEKFKNMASASVRAFLLYHSMVEGITQWDRVSVLVQISFSFLLKSLMTPWPHLISTVSQILTCIQHLYINWGIKSSVHELLGNMLDHRKPQISVSDLRLAMLWDTKIFLPPAGSLLFDRYSGESCWKWGNLAY